MHGIQTKQPIKLQMSSLSVWLLMFLQLKTNLIPVLIFVSRISVSTYTQKQLH